MAGLEIRNVRKSFGATPILHGVSIDIQDGEFVILVGPSGCGKSTLLRMIAGLENITAGEIRIGSRVVNAVPPKERVEEAPRSATSAEKPGGASEGELMLPA
ncbi:ATP-binding cassette domain-containing protein, partial [Methylobacterium tarhaniae]|uniref:ATP-binding cassette domain-containing protein n=1 Tax=Methylobacterium tarhaniae TaxID=1187852 RepID=UPI003CFFADAD